MLNKATSLDVYQQSQITIDNGKENNLFFPTELSISELFTDITKDILGSSATSPPQPELPGKKPLFQGKAQIAATYEPEMYTEINSNAQVLLWK